MLDTLFQQISVPWLVRTTTRSGFSTPYGSHPPANLASSLSQHFPDRFVSSACRAKTGFIQMTAVNHIPDVASPSFPSSVDRPPSFPDEPKPQSKERGLCIRESHDSLLEEQGMFLTFWVLFNTSSRNCLTFSVSTRTSPSVFLGEL